MLPSQPNAVSIPVEQVIYGVIFWKLLKFDWDVASYFFQCV
jgi:hypothetical protein